MANRDQVAQAPLQHRGQSVTTLHTSNSIARELHGQHWSSVRTYKRARQELLDTLEPNRSLQAAVKRQDNEFFVTKLKSLLKHQRRMRLDCKLGELADHPYRWLTYVMLAVAISVAIIVFIDQAFGY